jgi:hypothetical protein
MLLLLVGGILGLIYRRGSRRAFWVGFELFGWSYALMAFGPWFNLEVQTHLITTRAAAELYLVAHPALPISQQTQPVMDMDLYSYAYRSYDLGLLWERRRVNFIRVGHAVAAQVLAFLGGVLARRFHDSMRDHEPDRRLLTDEPGT